MNFFEKLTGGSHIDDESFDLESTEEDAGVSNKEEDWIEEETSEGELSMDVYQTPDEIIIKAMIAGVKPENLDVDITRDMVTVRGHREEKKQIDEEDYFYQELYWGSFSRTILLPQEIEPEESTAVEKHGLLEIHLPKIDRKKSTKLKVKSS
ncbi:Hsp20/alpha crystallin family protein [Patescibacteria group bacterium]